jgi:AraC-like DNA-binding protein
MHQFNGQWDLTPHTFTVGNSEPDLYLATLGRAQSTGHLIIEHTPSIFYIHIIVSGEGIMRVNGCEYTLGAGDLFCSFPGKHCLYYDRPSSPLRYYWITLAGRAVRDVLHLTYLTEKTPHARGDYAALYEPLFAEITAIYQLPTTLPTFPITVAWRFCDLLMQRRIEKLPQSSNHDYVAAAKQMMDSHAQMGLTVEEIAEKLGISRSHLFRLFHARYGVSPKAYLDATRLEWARRMLRLSDSTVAEISDHCGFQDCSYFSFAFKKHTGLTPSQYRSTKNAV